MRVNINKPEDLDGHKTDQCQLIDLTAETVRQNVITTGQGQQMVYGRKAIQAEEYLSVGAPSDLDGFIYIEMDAKALNISPVEAARRILEADAMWNIYFAKVEYERLLGKRMVMESTKESQVDSASEYAVKQIQAVKPEKAKPGDIITSVNGQREESKCCEHCHTHEKPTIKKPVKKQEATQKRYQDSTLREARSGYKKKYGESPVDCDPDGKGGWVCMGEQIGSGSPKKRKRR